MGKISTSLQRRPTWRLNAKLVPYVLLAPFVVLFLIFGLFPLVFSLFLAFQSWEPTSGLASMTYVGLDNFIFTLEDEWFWKSIKNTFGWLLYQVFLSISLQSHWRASFMHSSNAPAMPQWVSIFTLHHVDCGNCHDVQHPVLD